MAGIHLFATDASGLALLQDLGPRDEACAVIVPAHRLEVEKVERLADETRGLGLPLFVHPRGGPLPDDLPPAGAAVSWLYSQLLSARDLGRYGGGVLNMHGGRIPEYRGQSVLLWAIVNGEPELGVTWHEIVEEVDAGAIWGETAIPIAPEANAGEVRAAMLAAGRQLFPEAWRRFREGREPLRRPDLRRGRVWPRLRSPDRLIEAGWPGQRVRNLVRACCRPWPSATIEWDSQVLAIRGLGEVEVPGSVPYRTAGGGLLYLLPEDQSSKGGSG